MRSPQDDVEAQLWRSFRDARDETARHALFDYHRPLLRRIVGRLFRDRNAGDLEHAELQQLGAAGLLEAIDQFDPDRGVPFKYYGNRRIAGSILDGIAKHSEAREQIGFMHRTVRDRAASLADGLGEPDGLEATLAALAEVAVGLAVGFMLEGTSLYSRGDEADVAPSAYESASWSQMLARANEAITTLSERERLIMTYHYQSGMTFDAIAAVLGLTKGRVSQIHKQSISVLRLRLGAVQPPDR
jgi:RNA polymerase sigma factor FliA